MERRDCPELRVSLFGLVTATFNEPQNQIVAFEFLKLRLGEGTITCAAAAIIRPIVYTYGWC
jgi:hypothetical protein